MEAKKNPSKDVHRMRGMFFQIGLGVSVALMITAFEWRTEVKKVQFVTREDGEPTLLPMIPITNTKEPPPPSPIKNEAKPIASASLISISIEVTSSLTTDPTSEPTFTEPGLTPTVSFVPVADEPEWAKEIVVFPEKPPEPIGGYEAFYKMMRANLKYPRNAQRYNVAGKVFVEFVVNRDGTTVDMKVIRGIGYSCDEEAIRVIALSKWNPGKQRGRPVRVKMVMPITFKLN